MDLDQVSFEGRVLTSLLAFEIDKIRLAVDIPDDETRCFKVIALDKDD